MTLSTGKEITSTREANGSRSIDQELTEAEWQEYCQLKNVHLVAEQLRGNRWTIVPSGKNGLGQLGTCGYWPYAWTIEYVMAGSEQDALRKATYARVQFKQWQSTLA